MEAYYGIIRTQEYLEHHGVLGMKWGIRRYQPYSVVPRGSGKGGKFIGDIGKKVVRTAKSAGKKVAKKAGEIKKNAKPFIKEKREQAAEKKANRAAQREEKRKEAEELRKAAIKKSAIKLYAHQDEFSDTELNQAIKQLEARKKLRDLRIAEINQGKVIVDTILGYAKTGVDVYETGKRVKNVADEIAGKRKKKKDKKKFPALPSKSDDGKES